MASVFFKGPEGAPRWYARYRDVAGVWRSKRVRVESRKDATAIARRLEAEAERTRYGMSGQSGTSETVGSLAERWFNSLANRDWRNDRDQFRKWALSRFEHTPVRDITAALVTRWVAEMSQRSVTAESIRHHVGRLSRFLKWAVDNGHADYNACRQLPRGALPVSRSTLANRADSALVKFFKSQTRKGLAALWLSSKDLRRARQILSSSGLQVH